MPHWLDPLAIADEVEFAAIDFESAGSATGSTDVPVQVGLAIMRRGILDRADFFTSYLRCDREITWAAQRVHGISVADLSGAPALPEIWPTLKATLGGRVVVAHGAPTEQRFLRTFPMHGFGPWLDTLSLARALEPDLSSHALGDLIRRCDGAETELAALHPAFRWHDALSDAIATLVLLRHLITRAHLENVPVELLCRPDTRMFHSR